MILRRMSMPTHCCRCIWRVRMRTVRLRLKPTVRYRPIAKDVTLMGTVSGATSGDLDRRRDVTRSDDDVRIVVRRRGRRWCQTAELWFQLGPHAAITVIRGSHAAERRLPDAQRSQRRECGRLAAWIADGATDCAIHGGAVCFLMSHAHPPSAHSQSVGPIVVITVVAGGLDFMDEVVCS